jgi:hypothetical protein
VPLHVVHVVQHRRQRIPHVDDQHLPVGLALVDEAEDAERLDLLDVAGAGDGAADLAGVERVVVAGGVCRGWGGGC